MNTKQEEFFGEHHTEVNFIDITKPLTKLKNNKVVSLFTGAGGLDIGLEWAGFETAVCVEIDHDCIETIKHNRPNWNFIVDKQGNVLGDARNIEVDQILKAAGIEKGEAALVVGGAPCQPFSNIGKKMGKQDVKNGDLFLEFVRIVKGIRPRGFIFENVSGITQSKHKDVINHMMDSFTSMGYKVSHRILNAADYGVPQKRERFILLGSLKEVPPIPLPTHGRTKHDWNLTIQNVMENVEYPYQPWVTVNQAFKKIPKDAHLRCDFVLMNISDVVRTRMAHIGVDENFKVLPMKLRPKCWQNGGHQGQDTFGRLNPDAPAVTIRTSAYNPSKGKYIHPNENRGLSSIEMAVLQSFPLDWIFKCKNSKKITLVSAGKQIGNAVPPILACAIGKAIRHAL